jgi:hypothetical protein
VLCVAAVLGYREMAGRPLRSGRDETARTEVQGPPQS